MIPVAVIVAVLTAAAFVSVLLKRPLESRRYAACQCLAHIPFTGWQPDIRRSS